MEVAGSIPAAPTLLETDGSLLDLLPHEERPDLLEHYTAFLEAQREKKLEASVLSQE